MRAILTLYDDLIGYIWESKSMKNPEDLFVQVLIEKSRLQTEARLHSNAASLLMTILFLDQNPSKVIGQKSLPCLIF